jgi:hypothetical protein
MSARAAAADQEEGRSRSSSVGGGVEKGGEEDREGKRLQSMILVHFPLSKRAS